MHFKNNCLGTELKALTLIIQNYYGLVYAKGEIFMCKSKKKMKTKRMVIKWLMQTITMAIFWGSFIAVALIIYR